MAPPSTSPTGITSGTLFTRIAANTTSVSRRRTSAASTRCRLCSGSRGYAGKLRQRAARLYRMQPRPFRTAGATATLPARGSRRRGAPHGNQPLTLLFPARRIGRRHNRADGNRLMLKASSLMTAHNMKAESGCRRHISSQAAALVSRPLKVG